MTTRRELLIALGIFAVPLAAVSQQAKVPRLGFLGNANLEPTLGFFRKALRELGYIEGQNILLEIRSAEGRPDALPVLAAELVRLKVDVIVAYQTPAAHAAKKATNTIPIVMAPAGDPVATGLVASLARPGGNITGMSATTAELAVKTLELVREIRPKARSVGFLANTEDPFTKTFLEQIQSAGRRLGIEILPAMVRIPAEFDAAFAKWVKSKTDSVIVQPSLPRQRAIDLALKHRFLSVSPSRSFAEAGGLIGYSANMKYSAQKAAAYVDKILKGANPADLPVEQPTTFELAVNMKTAKALGVTIPPAVLLRANQLIE